MAVIYRTTGAWGAGKGSNLTAAEVDGNFNDHDTRIDALETSRPQPDDFASVSATGNLLTFYLQSGVTLGPVTMPTLVWQDRGTWLPFTMYAALDVVSVSGQGLFLVKISHTSAATFDPNLTAGSPPAAVYQLLIGAGSDTLLGDLADVDVTGAAANALLVAVLSGSPAVTTWEDRTPAQVTTLLDTFSGDAGAGGAKGLVPAPAAGDAAANKYLKASGGFVNPAIGEIGGLGANVGAFLAAPSSANLAAAVTDETGSGALVFATSPALTTPDIGAAVGTSLALTGSLRAGGAASNTGQVQVSASGGGTAGHVTGYAATTYIYGIGRGGISGSGIEIESSNDIGFKIGAAGTLDGGARKINIASTGLEIRGGTSGGVKINVPAVAGTNTLTLPAGTTDFSATGGAGQFVKQNSAGGALTVAAVAVAELSGLGAGVATFLATPSSANLAAAVTGETGSGALVFATSPTLTTPDIGAATGTSLVASGLLQAGTTLGISTDVLLARGAANRLELRNGTNAQAFRIYNTYPNASDNEFFACGWSANTLFFGTGNAGTGVARDVLFSRGSGNTVAGLINSDVRQGSGAALATTATTGFFLIATCAGVPTGVPTNAGAGQIPMIYDKTNNQLYIYNSGWKASGVFA